MLTRPPTASSSRSLWAPLPPMDYSESASELGAGGPEFALPAAQRLHSDDDPAWASTAQAGATRMQRRRRVRHLASAARVDASDGPHAFALPMSSTSSSTHVHAATQIRSATRCSSMRIAGYAGERQAHARAATWEADYQAHAGYVRCRGQ